MSPLTLSTAKPNLLIVCCMCKIFCMHNINDIILIYQSYTRTFIHIQEGKEGGREYGQTKHRRLEFSPTWLEEFTWLRYVKDDDDGPHIFCELCRRHNKYMQGIFYGLLFYAVNFAMTSYINIKHPRCCYRGVSRCCCEGI